LTIRLTKLRNSEIAREQGGFTLIEAVIGIALLSVVAVAVLIGVSTSFKANAVADKQSTAMSLAQSQVEDIQLQAYQTADPNSEVIYAKIASIPSNYSIWSYDRSGTVPVPNVVGVPWSSSIDGFAGIATVTDGGLQKIRLVIKQGSNVVLTLETYKVR